MLILKVFESFVNGQQTNFSLSNHTLSDFRVELSQDVASKGLGLVYELGSEQDQQELVSTLVETLMTGKRYSELENFRFQHTDKFCTY